MSVKSVLGPVKELCSSESKSLRTVIRRHENGFSVTHFRRHFKHLNGVEIPGTTHWVTIRIQEWTAEKVADLIDSRLDVKDPPEPVPGDIA